jgi:hypothetical protein
LPAQLACGILDANANTLAPSQFVDLAIELDVMEFIDAQVFAHAIEAFEAWRANEMEVPRLSINVSNKRPLEPDFIEVLIGAKKIRYWSRSRRRGCRGNPASQLVAKSRMSVPSGLCFHEARLRTGNAYNT